MWWTVFTIFDLYIGLVVIDAMKPSLPPEKLGRLGAARKVICGLIAICGIVLIAQIARRYGWLRI